MNKTINEILAEQTANLKHETRVKFAELEAKINRGHVDGKISDEELAWFLAVAVPHYHKALLANDPFAIDSTVATRTTSLLMKA